VTVAYLKACGVTDLAPWENDWHIARIEMRLIRAKARARTRTALPAPRDQLCEILNRLAQAKGLSLRAIAAQTKRCQAELASAGGPVHTTVEQHDPRRPQRAPGRSRTTSSRSSLTPSVRRRRSSEASARQSADSSSSARPPP
jgi:hypothetical protein